MSEALPDLFRATLIDCVAFQDLRRLPRSLGILMGQVGTDANGLETGG